MRLAETVNVTDVRRVARRKLPRLVFDFIEGAADDEVTARANTAALAAIRFEPHSLVDVTHRDLTVDVCGRKLGNPIMLAPTGLTRLCHPEGEIAAARAAHRRGSVAVLSSAASCSIEAVAAAVPAGGMWFQLYPWRDRALTEQLVERAIDAGYPALCVTVDCPVTGNRERDTRNGLTIPPRPTLKNAWDLASHPRWTSQLLRGSPITFANLATSSLVERRGVIGLAEYWSTQLIDPGQRWDDLEWIREAWAGPLLVKGLMTVGDAQRAVAHGADGVIVSNHGGRQLDGVPATAHALPRVAEAIGDQADVLVDGGIRRGSDVAKLLALGAKACLIGRPYCYGLAAGGEAGVERVLNILLTELDRTLALLGCPRVADLDPSFISEMPRDA